MINLETVLLVNILLSFGLSLVYFHLYSQYHEKYMGVWGISWLFFSVRIGLDLLRFLGHSNNVLMLLNQLITISSVVLLLWGMYIFSGQKIPRWWLYSAIFGTLATDAGVILGLPLVVSAIPTAAYFGVADIWTGIMFLRFWGLKGFGKDITGCVLILVGILNFTYPLISTGDNPIITTWFFSVASVLWLIILMGILLVYFEKVRNDLSISEKKFRLLAENAEDIIYRFNLRPNSHFEYISPSVLKITGYGPEELYQSPQLIFDILDERHHVSIRQMWESFLIPSETVLFLLHHKNGNEVWAEQHSVQIYDDAGNIVAVEGIMRDITERKKMETEMVRLNQLRIIGQTAAGIAHEIRNPMTTVKGFLQMLMEKADLDRYGEFLQLMKAELDRANTIITDFLSLSKEKKSYLKIQSLNSIILALKPIIETSALLSSKTINFELEQIPELQLDKAEISQLILNLVQNGLEAMDPGGILDIRTSLISGHVILAVKDRGKGIEPEVLEKLGEPFITTKEKGTGLGLAVSYSIAHRHNAKIEIETDHSGTTFVIEFPVANAD